MCKIHRNLTKQTNQSMYKLIRNESVSLKIKYFIAQIRYQIDIHTSQLEITNFIVLSISFQLNIIFCNKIRKRSSNHESINNELMSLQFSEILFGGSLTKNQIAHQPGNVQN